MFGGSLWLSRPGPSSHGRAGTGWARHPQARATSFATRGSRHKTLPREVERGTDTRLSCAASAGRRLTRIPVHVMLVVIAVACVVAIMPILLRQFRQLNEFLDHIQHKTNNTVYLQTDFEYWREVRSSLSVG